MKIIYDPFTGTYRPMNFGPDPQPTPKPPQPTLEQCLALLPTCKGYVGGWHITVFPGGDYGICSATSFLVRSSSLDKLHAWLLERQPPKTVMVEVLREDATALANNFRLSSPAGARVHNALKKALEN